MKNLLALVLCITCIIHLAKSQTYQLLAYDNFSYSNLAPLNGLSGGSGWGLPWDVQNGNTVVPGFNASSGSLTFGALSTSGNKGIGGYQYLTIGRRLNLSSTGPFAPFIANGEDRIGTQTGTTLWFSGLIRKEVNNSQPVNFAINETNLAWCDACGAYNVSFGYFGSNSDSAGQRYWTLRVNANYYRTSIPVQANVTAFAAIRIDFNAANTLVSLYANPTTFGNNMPPTPTLTVTTSPSSYRSIIVYLGDGPSQGAIDELRVADSFAEVAPDSTIGFNLAPIAVINSNVAQGQSPLAVTLNGSASSDPEGQPLTYLWHFGDGTPDVTGPIVNHSYTYIGEMIASLTVTDNVGQSNTSYYSIKVLNTANSFPCNTTATCLNLPSCSTNDGRIRINANTGISYTMYNSNNGLMSTTNFNEYHNLTPGAYRVYLTGTNGCNDSLMINMNRDSSTCPGWQPSGCALKLGTNLSGINYWGVNIPFKNLFKHSGEIITFSDTCYCWDNHKLSELVLNANGYPTYLPQLTSGGPTKIRYILSSENATLQMGKRYVMLYQGTGQFSYPYGINLVSNAAGRVVFDVTADGNIFVVCDSSTLGNPIRNIRLLRIEHEFDDIETYPFYQPFLDYCANFTSLRFMDWGATNGSPHINWNDRALKSYRTYSTDKGVPYELMVSLANTLKKDVWICVPHAADSNYIAKMANVFRKVGSKQNIYLEYSNEVWNWIFAQSHYNADNKPDNLHYGAAYSDKANNVFKIWHSVFGTSKNRVKRVLGLQASFGYLNEFILARLKPNEWDFASPTFYFGLDHGNTGNPVLNASSTVADVLANASNSFNSFAPLVKQDYRTVRMYGKGIVNYEGGQHFTDFSVPPYIQAMYDAQIHPGMYTLYSRVIDSVRYWGSNLGMIFSDISPRQSIWGSWGHLEYVDQLPPYNITAPKMQVVLDEQADCLKCNADAFEYNNSLITAAPLATGSAYQAYICPILDVDWYQFTATSTKNYKVKISQLPANYNLEVFNLAGVLVAGSYTTGSSADSVVLNYPSAGVYYARVFGANGAFKNNVPYTIRISESNNPFRKGINNQTLGVFPQPATQQVNFSWEATESKQNYTVTIYDAFGKSMLTKHVDATPVQIEISSWPAGIYHVLVRNDKTLLSEKFIKIE
ncbi:MAG: T9SS type A sorting domain-containing protein [Bacteroidetes bacterium]|nr:T9SS type A sorting domain-containing protein [Bacteroidota bacterium]